MFQLIDTYMHRTFYCLFITSLIGILCFSATVYSASANRLQVKGRFLCTPCGDTIVMRGFNKMCIYDETARWGMSVMPEMKKSGANALRIVWTISDKVSMSDTLDAVIQTCIDNAMIPVVEIHDATGDWSKLNDVLQYWLRDDVKAVAMKHEKYLVVNIANEAGDFNVTDADYQARYISIVQQMRAAGYRMPLMIDANGYGQNISAIINTAAAIIEADPDKNLIFSLHAYWQPKYFANPEQLFQNSIATIVAMNIPLVIGEFAGCYTDDPNSTDDLWKTILPQCQQYRIGWMAWEWGPGNADYSQDPPILYPKMDMTADGTFATLKDGWARSVVVDDANSITKTSIRCDYILNKGECLASAVVDNELWSKQTPELVVSPNPVQTQCSISFRSEASIVITDMMGKVLINIRAQGMYTVDTQLWSSGCYAVTLLGAEGCLQKLVLTVLH